MDVESLEYINYLYNKTLFWEYAVKLRQLNKEARLIP